MVAPLTPYLITARGNSIDEPPWVEADERTLMDGACKALHLPFAAYR